jgi:hypothetical protein
MYGRIDPAQMSTANISFFIGSFLTQVCFGKFDLGLNFDRPASSIMIQSSCGIQTASGALEKYDITDVTQLRGFLNRDVTGATWGEEGTLILEFEGGDRLMVFDDSDQYESYTISHGTTTIVV